MYDHLIIGADSTIGAPVVRAGSARIYRLAAQPGIYQLSGPHDVSYHTLAMKLARNLGVDEKLVEKISAIAMGMNLHFVRRHMTLARAGLEHTGRRMRLG